MLLSESHSTLHYSSMCLRLLMQPMQWTHICVPVLPDSMGDYLSCPTPYIFGVQTRSPVAQALLQEYRHRDAQRLQLLLRVEAEFGHGGGKEGGGGGKKAGIRRAGSDSESARTGARGGGPRGSSAKSQVVR